MKFAAVAVFAACVALSYSAPPATHAVDWPAVDAQITVIQKLVEDCVAQIRDTALGDNLVIGGVIVGHLEIAATEAELVFVRMHLGANGETLTAEQANNDIMEMVGYGNTFYQNAGPSIAQLSTEASTKIGNLVQDTIAQMIVDAGNLMNMLNA